MNTNSYVRNSHPCPKRRRAAAGGGAVLVQDAASWTGVRRITPLAAQLTSDGAIAFPVAISEFCTNDSRSSFLQNVPSMARVAAGASTLVACQTSDKVCYRQ